MPSIQIVRISKFRHVLEQHQFSFTEENPALAKKAEGREEVFRSIAAKAGGDYMSEYETFMEKALGRTDGIHVPGGAMAAEQPLPFPTQKTNVICLPAPAVEVKAKPRYVEPASQVRTNIPEYSTGPELEILFEGLPEAEPQTALALVNDLVDDKELRDFMSEVDKFDVHYRMSDDISVYRAGKAKEEVLEAIAEKKKGAYKQYLDDYIERSFNVK